MTEMLEAPAMALNSDWFKPQTLKEAMDLASVLAGSTIIPEQYQGKPGNVLLLLQVCDQLSMPLLAGFQNVTPVNKRLTIWGDLAIALVKAHPDCDDVIETFNESKNLATCTVKRAGCEPVVRTFSLEEAKKAGLTGRDIWRKYTERMIGMRARGFALRDSFPDALKGLAIREEVEDMPTQPAPPAPGTVRQSGVAGLKDKVEHKQQAEAEPAEQPAQGEANFTAEDQAATEGPSPRDAVIAGLKQHGKKLSDYSLTIEEITGEPLAPDNLPSDEHWPEVLEALAILWESEESDQAAVEEVS